MDRLLDLIDAGNFGLLHFACHDTFRPDAAGSSVVMGGGRLIPAFLNPAVVGGSLAGRRPLVFLNSSRSEAAIPEYTKLAGWAEQFITAGAAAFVGTSWPVRQASATAFAEAFYGTLQEGQALGAATSAARKAASADATEPSWLAYSVYGDPAASLQGL
jgi:CHAT domain-containing protein